MEPSFANRLWAFRRWILFLLLFLSCFVGCSLPGKKACNSDLQCDLGEFCETNHLCTVGCKNDSDCKQGDSCYLGKCAQKICEEGQKEECYEGKFEEVKQDILLQGGTCRKGEKVCIANGQKWSSCFEQVLPFAEICDGLDNDCDGKIDNTSESCDCTQGMSRTCQTQPDTHFSFSSSFCRKGIQYCGANGRWGVCKGEIKPFTNMDILKKCMNLDSNCDGQLNRGLDCECKKGEERKCFPWDSPVQGICQQGKQKCEPVCRVDFPHCDLTDSSKIVYRWSACPAVIASHEEDMGCNGKDDDCDGKIDNQVGTDQPILRRCALVPCKETIAFETCQVGAEWGKCVELKEIAESCNGKDDDCNGQIDDIVSVPCFSGRSGCSLQQDGSYACHLPCKTGMTACEAGKSLCKNETLPVTENTTAGNCKDGIDNNCDGKIDSKDPNCACVAQSTRPCFSALQGCFSDSKGGFGCKGICKAGIQTCNSFGEWGSCKGEIVPLSKEICGNDLDDDCNGIEDKDEVGCKCNPGETNKCYNGASNTRNVGACKEGIQECTGENRSWGICKEQVLPVAEICNNKIDDDCNGQIDDCIQP